MAKVGSTALSRKAAHVFVPNGMPVAEALGRTTALGVGAHPDDLEIMSWHGIGSCHGSDERWFTGIVVTGGDAGPRGGPYATYTDTQMRTVRRAEQNAAATQGGYAALAHLDFSSDDVKQPRNAELAHDLGELLTATRPEVVYTHSLFDRHDTHVAVAVHLIRAIRALPATARPAALYGCEVWRSLDWLADGDKVLFDVSAHADLGTALVAAHASQIASGKRYDLATLARKRAHATFDDARGLDQATATELAVDLTALIGDPRLDILAFADGVVQRFADDVGARLRRLLE